MGCRWVLLGVIFMNDSAHLHNIYIYIFITYSKNKYIYLIYTQIIYFHYSIDIYLDH